MNSIMQTHFTIEPPLAKLLPSETKSKGWTYPFKALSSHSPSETPSNRTRMMNRSPSLLPALLLALFAICSANKSAAAADPRPNILFLITDDQRFDMMGNVTPALHTPEMDRLAR